MLITPNAASSTMASVMIPAMPARLVRWIL